MLLSPEMLQAQQFSRKILHRGDVMQKLLLLGVDEAHCISYWGDSFRKQYSTIGSVRPFMPKGAPIVAVSATMPQRVQVNVAKTLCLESNALVLDVGNTRRDLTLICIRMQHTLISFRDLQFVIPKGYKTLEDIPKTIVYFDNIKGCVSMFDYLTSLLRPEHRKLGIIRPFNATHTHEFREKATAAFKEGLIRVLIPTDIFGMVCIRCQCVLANTNSRHLKCIRDATLVMRTWWFNGSYRRASQALSSVQVVRRERRE